MEQQEERINSIIQQEINGIRNIPVNALISDAISLMHEAVHKNGGKIIVSGIGKAGQIGHNIATTLSSTGTPAVFLHPTEAQHGDLGIMQNQDILFLISNSGKTRELLELIPLAKRLSPDIKSISMTGNPDSDLGRMTDVTLSTGHPQEVCPLGLTPTTSTTVMTVLGDILVVLMMEKIGFTKEAYSLRHHSGYLGHKSREL